MTPARRGQASLINFYLQPKQILINAHVRLRPNLVTSDIVSSIEEVEKRIKQAEPKVEMIFLEVARDDQPVYRLDGHD